MINIEPIILILIIIGYGCYQIFKIRYQNKQLYYYSGRNEKIYRYHKARYNWDCGILAVCIALLLAYVMFLEILGNLHGWDVVAVVALLSLESWEDTSFMMVRVHRAHKQLKAKNA